MITTLPELTLGPAFLEMKLFGVQPPSPGYFSRLAARQAEADKETERRIQTLIHMKALLTVCDVIDALEAA